MNKPVMPEMSVVGVRRDPSGTQATDPFTYGFTRGQMESHHAAWEAHCAALKAERDSAVERLEAVEARLREVEGLVQRWRTDGRVLFDDPHSDWRNGRGYAMLECADELTATLEQSNG